MMRHMMLLAVVVMILWSPKVGSAPVQVADLAKPRCWVSTKTRAIACPSYLTVRGVRDAGWLVLNVAYVTDHDPETLIVHVGEHYAGTVSFPPENGIMAVRSRLARDRFSTADAARPVTLGAWSFTKPRTRLVYKDEVQHDAILEVECKRDRVVRDELVITGLSFFIERLPADRLAIFGQVDEGDHRFGQTTVSSRIVDLAALCANAH
jgi:hypothetical protein